MLMQKKTAKKIKKSLSFRNNICHLQHNFFLIDINAVFDYFTVTADSIMDVLSHSHKDKTRARAHAHTLLQYPSINTHMHPHYRATAGAPTGSLFQYSQLCVNKSLTHTYIQTRTHTCTHPPTAPQLFLLTRFSPVCMWGMTVTCFLKPSHHCKSGDIATLVNRGIRSVFTQMCDLSVHRNMCLDPHKF